MRDEEKVEEQINIYVEAVGNSPMKLLIFFQWPRRKDRKQDISRKLDEERIMMKGRMIIARKNK